MAFKTFTKQQRTAFMEAYGVKVANWGGTFGVFRDAGPAFEYAKTFKPYADMGLDVNDADFADFEKGFLKHQQLRVAMQLSAKDAQKVMHDILTETEIPSTTAKVKSAKELTAMFG